MNAIEISGVIKRHADFTLGPVDLQIRRGEFFGIFGPPSSGKTSLLRLILGLLEPDAGQVLLDGRPANELDVAARRLAMVFQNLALFPHLTGRENIVFTLVERGMAAPQVERRLAEVASVLHVGHILHKLPGQMSGGERQRIALGRALAAESRAILLDEPIAALDARLREEMRVELKRLQRAKEQTFVYVSHDEEEVMAVSDRVAVVIDGRIAQVGTPDEIYRRPASLAVARVVGSPPMNLFHGRICADGSRFECDSLSSPVVLERAAAPGDATLGIRPEDIHGASDDGPEAQPIAVDSVEPLGGYSIVNAMLGGQRIKVRASGQLTHASGFSGRVRFDDRRVHLFDTRGTRLA